MGLPAGTASARWVLRRSFSIIRHLGPKDAARPLGLDNLKAFEIGIHPAFWKIRTLGPPPPKPDRNAPMGPLGRPRRSPTAAPRWGLRAAAAMCNLFSQLDPDNLIDQLMDPDLTQRIISTFAPYPAPPSAAEQKSTIVDEKMPPTRQKTTANAQTLSIGMWDRQRCVSACIKTENAFRTPLSFELCTPCINSANLAGQSAP